MIKRVAAALSLTLVLLAGGAAPLRAETDQRLPEPLPDPNDRYCTTTLLGALQRQTCVRV